MVSSALSYSRLVLFVPYVLAAQNSVQFCVSLPHFATTLHPFVIFVFSVVK